jgi:hypothetical protein
MLDLDHNLTNISSPANLCSIDISGCTIDPSTSITTTSSGAISITSHSPLILSTASSGTINSVDTCTSASALATRDYVDDNCLKIKHSEADKMCDENDCVVYTQDLNESMVISVHNMRVNVACLMCDKCKKVNMKEKLAIITCKQELRKI